MFTELRKGEYMNKLLICYFSAAGATKRKTEKLSEILNADLFEIDPVDKYTSEDLDWNNEESRTTQEKNDENIRPSIKNKVENIKLFLTPYR